MKVFYISDIPLWGGFWNNTVAVWLEHPNQEPMTTLKVLQTLVDGYVDCVAPAGDLNEPSIDMWVNDEGLYRPDFVRNTEASYLAQMMIVGPVALAKANRKTGETLGFTDEELRDLSDRHSLNWDGATYLVDEIVSANSELREALTLS